MDYNSRMDDLKRVDKGLSYRLGEIESLKRREKEREDRKGLVALVTYIVGVVLDFGEDYIRKFGNLCKYEFRDYKRARNVRLEERE